MCSLESLEPSPLLYVVVSVCKWPGESCEAPER